MLVNPKDCLVAARREGWAMGGFNVYNLESARAVVQAAEEARAPVIVQTSEGGAVEHGGMAQLAGIIRALADAASVRSPSTWTMARASRSPAQPSMPGTRPR